MVEFGRRDALTMTPIEDTTPAPAPLRLSRRLPLIGFGIFLIVVVILLGAGFAGYQAGLSQRDIQARASQAADLDQQYQLGLSDIAAGRYQVAQARFEYILQLDPGYRDAGQKLAQVRAAMAVTPTTTPLAATAAPSPTIAATQSHAAADLFAQAQTQYAAADWDGVIETLGRLNGVDPTYEAVKANGMLYIAYRNRGVAQISGTDIESGMFDLDKAEAIGPLDSEALNYRAWGRLYLAAQSFWGLNWGQAMEILQQLHLIAPYFHDTSALLYTATVNYADQLARSGDNCGAAQHYAEAQALKADPKIAEALATATVDCALTPTAPPTGTPGTPEVPGSAELATATPSPTP
jgi:tetratricopeptide (TPR) repeat protein